jgi:DNA-binding MarR family transcriptional regulator
MRAVSNPRPLGFDAIAEARRQWEAHEWAAPGAMAATTSIMRAHQIVLARTDEALRPFDLTFARYEALVLLAFSRQGALPLGKMGDRLMLHPTSVTNIIDRLERQGLVRRVGHPTDRRTVLAEITEDGRRMVDKATEAVSATSFGMGALTERELDQVTRLLRKVRIDAGDFPADG